MQRSADVEQVRVAVTDVAEAAYPLEHLQTAEQQARAALNLRQGDFPPRMIVIRDHRPGLRGAVHEEIAPQGEIAVPQGLHHEAEVPGAILVIRIQEGDQLAPGLGQSRIQGRGLPLVGSADHPQLGSAGTAAGLAKPGQDPGVSSVLPSSTTMCSQSRQSWPRTDCIAPSRNGA